MERILLVLFLHESCMSHIVKPKSPCQIKPPKFNMGSGLDPII